MFKTCPTLRLCTIFLACLYTPIAGAAFQPVEDFDNLLAGSVNGQNDWINSDNAAQVVADPSDATNQVLMVSTESALARKALSIPAGTTRMLYLRMRFAEHGRFSWGVSPMSAPTEYSDFGPELGLADSTAGDPNNDFRVANGSTTGIYDVLETLSPDVWYNIWVRIDTAANSYEVWLNDGTSAAATAADQLDNAAAETLFGFRTATSGGTNLQNFFIKTGGGSSPVTGSFYIDDLYVEDSTQVNLQNPTVTLAASVLPGSRSVEIGQTASAFATIINASAVSATGCGISPQTPVPAAFSFQTTDATTNLLVGSANQIVDIPAMGQQSFVFAYTGTDEFGPTDVILNFDCANTAPAPTLIGVNTLLLSISNMPVADVVALSATASNDGIVTAAPSTAFAVASINVGSEQLITASADTGDTDLPLSLFVCETTSSGDCLTAPDSSVTTLMTTSDTRTFSIFVNADEGASVPFDPGINRVFVHFKDPAGVTRGMTSVAVRTQ